MEDHFKDIRYDYFDTAQMQRQVELIKKASEVAQKKIDYRSAHDENIQHAIEVIEQFLRQKHRLCYGGQAINAHLPNRYKIYDPEYSVPDYDFFTPQQHEDVLFIIKMLKKAGFVEIGVKEGMHEGTLKIYVDYVPVADLTAMDKKMFTVMSKREFRVDGISYLDANTLRMLMYLELSRPKGEVERWSKVYERLMIFNEFAMKKSCASYQNTSVVKGYLAESQTRLILSYVMENKHVFAGGDLIPFYRSAIKSHHPIIDWILSSHSPIIFYSNEPQKDAITLQQQLTDLYTHETGKSPIRDTRIHIKSYITSGADLIPSIKVILQGKNTMAFIIHTSACHSYLTVPLDTGNEIHRVLRIASMDTLISLYFSLGLIQSKFMDLAAFECLASQLIQINIRIRNKKHGITLPFISLKCSGHQSSMPSLIRAKVIRLQDKRKRVDYKKIIQGYTPRYKWATLSRWASRKAKIHQQPKTKSNMRRVRQNLDSL